MPIYSVVVVVVVEPKSTIQLFKALGSDLRTAQRARIVRLKPLSDARRVEVVSRVARKWCHFTFFVEYVHADGTLRVLLEV